MVEVRWENEKGEVKWEPTTIVNTPNMFGDVYEPIWVAKEKGEYSSSEVEKSDLRKLQQPASCGSVPDPEEPSMVHCNLYGDQRSE